MELKLSRTELNGKPKSITLEKIEEKIADQSQTILYFDKENSHKDLVELVEYFEGKDKSVYLREIKFGLGVEDYMYEVHIIQ